MGRNGAGKSTLLRHAAGLLEPTRGRVERAGRVALLLQNPGDYFIARARRRGGLAREALARRPGSRHWPSATRATFGRRAPAPGARDRRRRRADASRRRPCSRSTSPRAAWTARPRRSWRERAARAARERGAGGDRRHARPRVRRRLRARAVLLADGRVIADGPAAELLAGGWYFATETARILGGAGGALLPEQGAAAARGPRRPRARSCA